MSGKQTKETIAGALTFAALLGLIAWSYGGGTDGGGPGTYEVTAAFNRVDGLFVGDEVRLSGIQVGRVQKLSLDQQFRARAVMRLDDDVDLPTDTAAAIHTDGLFGAKFIVLSPGGDETSLKDGDVITFTQDSVVVDELLELIIAQGKANQRADSGEGN